MAESIKILSQLKEGDRGIITELEQGPFTVQLCEMGFLTGTEVEVYKIAPLGDPMVVTILGTEVTLRKQEAALVLIQHQT